MLPTGTVCAAQCTQRAGGRTVGVLPWGPLLFVCVVGNSSAADSERVVTGSWAAVPSQLRSAPVDAPVPASLSGAIATACIPLTVTASPGALRLDACGVVRRLVWPALALDPSVPLSLSAATVGRAWSNGSFAMEAAGQAAAATGVLFAPVPRYHIAVVAVPATRSHVDASCVLEEALLSDVSGHVNEHVFRVDDVRAALGDRPASCNGSPPPAAWNVSLRVDALAWDAALSAAASPAVVVAAAAASTPVAFGSAVVLSDGALSLRPVGGGAEACRVVLPSWTMLSSTGLAPSAVVRSGGAVTVSDALPPVVLTLSAPVAPATGETLSASCGLAASLPGLVQLTARSTAISQAGNASLVLSGLFQAGGQLPEPARRLRLTCNVSRSVPAGVFPAYAADVTVSQPLYFLPARWPLFENAIVHYYGDVPDVRALALSDDRLAAATEPLAFAITTPTSVNVTLVGDTRHWLREDAVGQFSRETTVYVGGVACRTFPDEAPRDGSRLKFRMPRFDEVCASPNASTCAVALAVRNSLTADLAVQVACPPFCPDGLPKSAAGLPLAIGIASAASASNRSTRRRLSAATRTSVVVPAAAAPSELSAFAAEPADAPPYEMDLELRVTYVSECLNGTFTDVRLPVCSNASDPRSYSCALGSRDECVTCPSFALCPGGGRMLPRPGFFVASLSSLDITPCAPPGDRCLGWNASSNAVACAPRFRPRSPGCGACADLHFPTLDGDCAPCRAAVTVDGAILSAIGIVLGVIVGVVVALVGGAWLAIRVMDGGTVKNVVQRGVQLLVILVTGMQVQVVVSERANSGLPGFITELYSYLQIFTFTNLGIHPACAGKYGVFRVQLSLFLAASVLLALQLCLLVNWRRTLGCTCCGLRKREIRALLAPAVVEPRDIPDSALDSALDEPSTQQSGARASVLACCRAPASGTRSQRRLELQRASEQKKRSELLAAQPWHVRLGVAYAQRKPQLRRLLFTVSTLMFPAVVGNILQAVHCVPRDVRVRDYRNMGQDGTTLRTLGIAQRPSLQLNGATGQLAADADAERVIRVRVLARDPFFVCAEGEHRLVNSWALCLLVVYVVLQPLATFFLSRAALARLVADTCADEHHQALEADRARQRAYLDDAGVGVAFVFRKLNVMLCCGGRRYVRAQGAALGADAAAAAQAAAPAPTFDSHNPLRPASAPTAAAAPTPSSSPAGPIVTADDLVDRAVLGGKCADSAVEFFVRNDFRATRFWVRHVELALLLLLTVANKAWPQPAGIDARIGSIILRACLTWSAIGAAALVYAAQQPFTPENAFMRNVKLMHFLVIAVLESVNLVNSMILTRRCQSLEAISLTECKETSLTGTAGPLEASLSLPRLVDAQAALSVISFILALLFFAVAFGSFGLALYDSIEREASEQHHEAVTAAAAALQRPDGVGALAPSTARLSSAAAAVKKRQVVRVHLREDAASSEQHGDDEGATAEEGEHAAPTKPEALARAKTVLAVSRRKLGAGALTGTSMRGDFGAKAARQAGASQT